MAQVSQVGSGVNDYKKGVGFGIFRDAREKCRFSKKEEKNFVVNAKILIFIYGTYFI